MHLGHLNKALAKVKEHAGARSAVGRFAASLLPLLEAAAEEVRGEVVRQSRRGTGEISYLVEKTQQGEVLTERKSNSKPYRCPRRMYETLATVLASAERPLLLDEIVERMAVELMDRPADHQVRVALRLWMHVQPPLVVRNRARHSASHADQFTKKAEALWIKLRVENAK